MKKFGAIALASVILSSLVVSAGAAFVGNQTDVGAIKYTIPQGYAEHKLDGVISEGEYQEIVFSTNELSFAAYDEAAIDASVSNPISLHMSYDADYVYVAATTIAKDYICEIDDPDSCGNIWAAYAIQLSFASAGETDASMRLETGYAQSSTSDIPLFCNWNDGMGIGYSAYDNNDFIVNVGSDTITYEMRVPYEAFGEKKLVEGDQFLFSIVWATGTSEAGAADQYIHEQLAYGITGDPGKDVTGHATITLGAALEAPVVDEPAADEPATDAPATPATADAGIVAAAAVMAVAAGVVLSKKH